MRGHTLIWFLLFVLLGCQSDRKFDAEKWKDTSAPDFAMTDIRERMVDDLISSEVLIGKTIPELISMLGIPETREDDVLKYLIREKYGRDIDPDYIKYLVLSVGENGKVTKQEVLTTK